MIVAKQRPANQSSIKVRHAEAGKHVKREGQFVLRTRTETLRSRSPDQRLSQEEDQTNFKAVIIL